jgi:hypothetical protein
VKTEIRESDGIYQWFAWAGNRQFSSMKLVKNGFGTMAEAQANLTVFMEVLNKEVRS